MILPLLLLSTLSPGFEQIAGTAHGRVGMAAVVLENSANRPVELRGAERFPMQSVYKFPIAMAVLNAVDQGLLSLDQQVLVSRAELVPAALHSPVRDKHPGGDFRISLRELLRYAVSESDGTASDVLLRIAGGPSRVQTYLRSLGITDVAIATTEMEMARDDRAQYRNWATPRGMVALLRALQEGRGLSGPSRASLVELMKKTGTGPKRLKGRLPAGTAVAHKTGTSGTVRGVTAATNDVGLVTLPNGRTMAIAVFVTDSPADEGVREDVIARLARAAWDQAVTP